MFFLIRESSGLPWNGSKYPVKGFNDASGQPVIPFSTGLQVQANDDDLAN